MLEVSNRPSGVVVVLAPRVPPVGRRVLLE
jgi:hypothetical protein